MIKFNKSITIKGLDSDDNDNCECKDDDEDNVQLRVNPCDRCHTCGKSADSLAQISVGKALFSLHSFAPKTEGNLKEMCTFSTIKSQFSTDQCWKSFAPNTKSYS